MILDTIKKIHRERAVNDVLPVFLAGDFNVGPQWEAYLRMSSSEYMYDLQTFVDLEQRYGGKITFTGFEPAKNKDEQGRIDYIWMGPKDRVCGNWRKGDSLLLAASEGKEDRVWVVGGYAVLPNVFDNGIYLSDHRCVVGDVHLHW
jgi:hypothetical protein